MKTAILGGTGLIGTALTKVLQNNGHEALIISRQPLPHTNIEYRVWNPEQGDADRALFAGIDAVVNLSGANISKGRWTKKRKQQILDSRVLTNRKIVQAFSRMDNTPRVFITGSAVGYYGPAGDKILDEASPPGHDFLASVCVGLEEQAFKARQYEIRTVALRTGVVLAAGGGALPKMVLPFKLGRGGRLASGRQWFPWIHIDDVARLILFVLENDALEGPINAVSPGIVTNRGFTKTLAGVLRRPAFFPVPEVALRVALGEMAQAVLASQRVEPAELLSAGYQFYYPQLKTALQDLLHSPSG